MRAICGVVKLFSRPMLGFAVLTPTYNYVSKRRTWIPAYAGDAALRSLKRRLGWPAAKPNKSSAPQKGRSYTAAAPPTISDNSCVMLACRALLYFNFKSSIILPALSEADFIATMRADCSEAMFSTMP